LIILNDGNNDDLLGGSINVKTNPEKFGGGSGRMVPFLNSGRVGVPPPSKNGEFNSTNQRVISS